MQYGLSPGVQEMMEGHTVQVGPLIAGILQDGIERGEFLSDLGPAADALLVYRVLEGVGDLVADGPERIAGIFGRGPGIVMAAVASLM